MLHKSQSSEPYVCHQPIWDGKKVQNKKCYSDMVASRNIFIKRRAAVLSKIYKYMVLMT